MPLTPERSLAVDRTHYAYGLPVWVDAQLPLGPDGQLRRFRRLMMAEDTGSAIVGPARGDIFLASGEMAGRLRHPGRFVVLLPTALLE